MGDGIYVALSGAISQSTALETTATNLANSGTDGYQRLRPVFREVLARTAGGPAPKVPHHFGVVAQTSSDTSQGSVRKTDRALDFVMPEGTYLAVQTPRGERYTRAGSLQVGTDGVLKTSHGDPVVGEDGKPIKVAAASAATAKLGTDGSIEVDGVRAGRLRLVTFPKPDCLTHEGNARMAAAAGAGAPTPSSATIEVGAVEESNSQVVSAMTELVSATRTFDAFQRAIEAFRDADRRVTSTVPNGT
jgi:flagellar basal body rod protein FlgG